MPNTQTAKAKRPKPPLVLRLTYSGFVASLVMTFFGKSSSKSTRTFQWQPMTAPSAVRWSAKLEVEGKLSKIMWVIYYKSLSWMFRPFCGWPRLRSGINCIANHIPPLLLLLLGNPEKYWPLDHVSYVRIQTESFMQKTDRTSWNKLVTLKSLQYNHASYPLSDKKINQ